MTNVKASRGAVAKTELTLWTSVTLCQSTAFCSTLLQKLKEVRAELQRGNIHLWKVNLHRKAVPPYLLLSKIIESLELEGISEVKSNSPAMHRNSTARSGCPGPDPASPWKSPGMRHQPHHWATCCMPHQPHCKISSPYIQHKPTLFVLETISPCSITTDPIEESSFLYLPCRYLKSCYHITSQPSLLQAGKPLRKSYEWSRPPTSNSRNFLEFFILSLLSFTNRNNFLI